VARSSKRSDPALVEEIEKRLSKSGTVKQMGFTVEEAEPGRVVLKMHVKPHHKQVHGVVHGGVLATLADTAGGMATHTTGLDTPRSATIEMKINYLEAVDHGDVIAEARVVRRGRHIAVIDCDVHNDRRLVAKALMTFYVGPFGEKKPIR
jgi:acyl-CoA thioesterase